MDTQNLKTWQAFPDSCVCPFFLPMNRRRRVLLVIRFWWIDALVAVVLLATAVGALIQWPNKIFAAVAISTALVIAFVVWRER